MNQQPLSFFHRIRKLFSESRHGKQVILVYSMGKVGSTTLKNALELKFPWIPVFHIHFLSDEWLRKRLPALPGFFQAQIRNAEAFFEFRKANPDRRLKIITLVREPVSREVSDVFENWKGFFGTRTIEDAGEERILQHLREGTYEYVLGWFDTEFKNWSGIDIYSHAFDREKGYSIWNFPEFDLLAIKLEKLSEAGEEATKALCGFPILIRESANKSTEKAGSGIYKSVMKKFREPAGRLDPLYQSKYMQHFYTEEEIAAFRRRWIAGPEN
jgi:hypothetical protein